MTDQRIVVLTTSGLSLHYDLLNPKGIKSATIDQSPGITFFKTHNNDILIWSKTNDVGISLLKNWDLKTACRCFFHPLKRSQLADFSPKGTFLWVWCSFLPKSEITNNFYVYRIVLKNESPLKEVYNSKVPDFRQSELFWSKDESYCIQHNKDRILIFEHTPEPFCQIKEVQIAGINSISASLPFVSLCVDSIDNNLPSFFKLAKFPDLNSNFICNIPFSNKKEFEFFWNKKGNSVIILCNCTDIGTHLYYGLQAAYFLNHKGESFQIELGKDNAIHQISWFPSSDYFTITYGAKPPLTTVIFNHKGDPIHKLAIDSFNTISIDPFENMVCLCGLGSFRSYAKIIHLKDKRVIVSFDNPHATHIMWMNDGRHVIFTTLASKHNLNNGYRICDYNSNIINTFSTDSKNKSENNHQHLLLNISPLNFGDIFPVPVINVPNQPIDKRSVEKPDRFVLSSTSSHTLLPHDSGKSKARRKSKKKKNSDKTIQT